LKSLLFVLPSETMSLFSLPEELVRLLKSYMNQTRLNWRTCKRREAALIRSLEWRSAMALPDFSEWTLAGRLLIEKANAETPGWYMAGHQRQPPALMNNSRWYLLEYRWIKRGPSEGGGW
jgi:hypothetical protein